MKTPNKFKALAVIISFALIGATEALSQNYTNITTGTYAAGGANPIEKSATPSPNDLASFTPAISSAFTANLGGIFNLPTTVANGTLTYRGVYGTSQTKALVITSSTTMQNVTASGSFTPVSGNNSTCSLTDVPGYDLTLGGPIDATTGNPLTGETVTQVGFTILSRTHATYPLDIRATASFSDGTTNAVTARVGNVKSADDTFFGFTAPSGAVITKISLHSFSTNTLTPVNTRISWDDFGFITSQTGIAPPPQILNVAPVPYVITSATNGIQFEARSVLTIPTSGLSLILNSNDVSASLVITGNSTNRFVSYTNLIANQTYIAVMTISNDAGALSVTNRFYTMETNFTLFHSGGFSNSTIYPVGPLQAVADGESLWFPATEPSDIVDLGGDHEKVLRRTQTGNDQIDILQFPFISSGIVTISLDARVSNPNVRTLDLCLLPASGGSMASFLAFGTNSTKLSYFDGSAWVAIADLNNEWHHLDITNFLSGFYAGKFDLSLDGVLIGQKLVWRNVIPALTPFGRLRVGAIRGGIVEYGEVDNLVIGAGPAPVVALPVTILNPAHSGSAFTFSFVSQVSFSHVVEFRDSLSSGTWATLETIPGDGSLKIVTDNNLSSSNRFYRVQTE